MRTAVRSTIWVSFAAESAGFETQNRERRRVGQALPPDHAAGASVGVSFDVGSDPTSTGSA